MKDFLDIINSIFNLDIRTLIGVLFWGNVTATILIYLFHILSKDDQDRKIVRKLIIIHLFCAIGYMLLFLRGTIPDIFSVNFGNTILFTCFYLEATLFPTITESLTKGLDAILKYILIISILIFNILELIFIQPSLRITMASVIIFAILCLPTFKLLTKKNISRFNFGIGIFYLILLLSSIPRTIISFYSNISLHTNNFVQTLFFLSLIIMMVSSTMVHLLLLKEKNDKIMENLAKTDGLTRISNRWNFMNEAERILKKCRERNKEIAVIFFDIDNFKSINDSYGHRFGDKVLMCFADILRNEISMPDLVCRYGGEEFVVVLYDSDIIYGKKEVLSILKKAREYRFPEKSEFHFTLSAGMIIATPDQDDTLSEIIDKCDVAMYAAKQKGKDGYVVFSNELLKKVV